MCILYRFFCFFQYSTIVIQEYYIIKLSKLILRSCQCCKANFPATSCAFLFLRDNFSLTEKSRKARFTRVTGVVECCQMCWKLHHMQHICSRYATKILICIGHFSVEILGNVLLRVTISGASDSEYFEMMLASIEKYLLGDIARQHDMSKITK